MLIVLKEKSKQCVFAIVNYIEMVIFYFKLLLETLA